MTLSVIHLTILDCQEGVSEGGSFLIDLMYNNNKQIQYILLEVGCVC